MPGAGNMGTHATGGVQEVDGGLSGVDRNWGRPVVLRRMHNRWPWLRAMGSWEYWREVAGHQLVTASLDVEERSGSTRKVRTTIAEFVGADPSGTCTGKARRGEPSSAYVKQVDVSHLHRQSHSAIIGDVARAFPDAWAFSAYLWLGHARSTTGLHCDDERNVLCQLLGTKAVTVFPPSDAPYLYTNALYDDGTVCCDVDPSHADLVRFPLFSRASPLTVGLAPGDVLFLPAGWYHQVESQGASISVNVFFSSPLELLTKGLVRLAFRWLHWAGLWRPNMCVCHSRRQTEPGIVARSVFLGC